ncbi:hypothetical protein [Phormidium sp. CCY1219]|uniref:hypothetical protein n=1 Tax=Phormidium sp. CCY1219 TaxID=2886104 RepID=UPI002D1F41C0|nr:hypothetical protein [Phormidium sp. CCY1219]MEB3826258.1 hypothetical protein [Phormidium sp. CCY1219]
MSPRSLVASEEGLKKAERALQRHNLTKTAIAKELAIASWTTVSKFFNCKPVDRPYFQEICRALDLDWQEIAGIPSESHEPEPDSPPVESIIEEAFAKATPATAQLETVTRNASRTRKALEPYILPAIRREALLDKCLSQIAIGLAGKQRVVPILGAAGYGKSTLLGTLYDELLTQNHAGWIALVRCDDLIGGSDRFPEEVGEKVSDSPLSIVAVAQQLTAQRGRGVLLLDTLDIILTKPLVPVLRLTLSQLLESGTTVAFTCRDSDYADFFEPYHESFAGFRESVYDGCKIAEFDREEVATAARTYAALKPEYPTPESQISFASRILDLSADRVSLAEIVGNPLLLALLCELFAEAQVVPEDLTVSQLYDIYWTWKISKVRHQQQSPRIGKSKEKLCLFLAETLYQNSEERLRDFIYETQFDLSNETDFAAYTALRSDGVLKEFGNHRIGFFHQTFLEYAIARWLNATESGERTQAHIRRQFRANSPEIRHYLWPIFRQLLTLVALEEFYRICTELDKQQLLPFRAIAFAAVSRTEPESASVLLQLFDIAKTGDYAFLEALLIAANSAPIRHSNPVWEVVVRSLSHAGKELINKTIEVAAGWIARSEAGSQRFRDAISALDASALTDTRLGHTLWGKFLGEYYRSVRNSGKSLDLPVLEILKQQYSAFGSHVRAIAIDLYLTPGVPTQVQRDFLLTILEIPPANNSFVEKENAVTLLLHLLPDLIADGNSPFGNSWFSVLDAELQPEWVGVCAVVVGQKAARDPELVEAIARALFEEPPPNASKSFNRSSAIALQEAIQSGGADTVASALVKRDILQIAENRISTLAMMVRQLGKQGWETTAKDEEWAVKLGEWIQPVIDSHPVEWIGALDALAVRSPGVQTQLSEVLQRAIASLKPKKINLILKKLAYIPPAIVPYLQQNRQSKECRIALLKLAQQEAEAGSSEAVTEIIAACADVSQDVAKDASGMLWELARQQQAIAVESLLPILANSRIIGVRQNCFQAILERVNAKVVSPAQIVTVFEAIATETAPEILQLAYKLTTAAIWNHPSGERMLELPIANAAFALTRRIVGHVPQKTIDAIGNIAMITFNQMVLLEERQLIPELTECTRLLFRSVDIAGKIDKLVVTGLLSHLAKFDSELLSAIITEDWTRDNKILPIANQQALVVAISNNEGKMSPLLDRLLADPSVPEETKTRILRDRNL